MRRWDRLVDQYVEEYTAAGRAASSTKNVRRELERWGLWLKNRRPRPRLEEVSSDLIQGYIRERTVFKSKTTLSGVMSKMRCMGEFLVREGYWRTNALRWMRGPKLDRRHRLPRRLSMTKVWELFEATAESRTEYHRVLGVTLLSVLIGSGARRGEMERLDLEHWNREEGTLHCDGRKTGWERIIPVPPLVRSCMEAYLPKRQNRLEATGRLEEKALFVNKDGQRLRGTAMSRLSG